MKVFQRTRNIVTRRVAGELFLVPVAGNLADMQRIFTLTKVAEFIWERLDGQKSLSDILNDVVERFDIDEEQADSDIQTLVTKLLTEGLVQEIVR
jgi:hypothetical protein